jgi:hypothetical protein
MRAGNLLCLASFTTRNDDPLRKLQSFAITTAENDLLDGCIGADVLLEVEFHGEAI